MKITLSLFAAAVMASSTLAVRAANNTNAQPAATSTAEDPAYTATIEKRTADILALLDIKDKTAANATHDAIIGQYRALNAWHTANDAKLKDLRKKANDKDATVAGSAKAELDQVQDSLKTLHANFLAALAAELTPEQVEKVKDKMTYGKVQFTFAGYTHAYPNLTEEQKAHILDLLKEAREQAMDGGSSEEKTAIFTKYKGKINNYLSTQGLSSKTKKADKSEPAK